jgi:cell division septum initiation protein DivIVA
MTQDEINNKAEEFEFTNGTYGFKAGVKFAQSKMYSEEEVYNLLEKVVKDVEQEQLDKHFSGDYRFLKEYFETIKKK